MKAHSLRSALRSVVAHRGLLRSIVVRDVQLRYRGTILGMTWALMYPLLMLAVYTYLFRVVFKARWGAQEDLGDFVLMMYCGLVTYTLMSETLMRSPTAVLGQPNFVKKVVFPLELLPLSQLGASFFNACISLILIAVFVVMHKHSIPVTTVALPLVVGPLLLVIAGLAWLLAAVGVFFRDIGQVIGVAMTVLLSVSPVFYPVSSTPPPVQRIIYANPLTYPIEEIRAVLIEGTWPHWISLAAYSGLAVATAVAGLWVFQSMRTAFADVV